MQESFDELIHLCWTNGDLDCTVDFALRMQAAENRKWTRKMQMIFGSEKKQRTTKGAVIPQVPQIFEEAQAQRIQRLKESGLL